MRQPAKFEYRDEFADFLPENGVDSAVQNYLSWLGRASERLGRPIVLTDLTCAADVEKLVAKIKARGVQSGSGWSVDDTSSRANVRSALRKYAQMVQSNYRGLFANVPAAPAPVANDVDAKGIPTRVQQTVYRIVRDTEMSREVKRLYEFRCQVCGVRLEIEPGVFYAEAHHLQPLGGEHQGPDVRENILCLCPNHHALFDYFAWPIDPAHLALKHSVGLPFIAYHNARANQGRVV